MKPLLILCLALPACTVVQGDVTKGTYKLATVGGDLRGYAQSASGVTAETVDNSTSFREGNKTIRFGIGAAVASGIAKDLAGAFTNTRNAKTAAEVSKASGSEATKQAAIAADLKKTELTLAAEEAAAAELVITPVP